jgi:tetratricopeptide (TPR) repeat protein
VIATLDVLSEADDSVVANAYALVRDLPPIEHCGDIDALTRSERPPAEGVSPELLEALEASSARARALVTAGRYAETIEVAAEAWQQSAPLEPHPLRAKLGRSYATALARRDRFDEAVQTFRDALGSALASSADTEVANIALSFAHELANHGDRGTEALLLAELAAGIAERPQAPQALRAGAASVLGQVHRGLGRWDEALEYDRRALELRLDVLGEDHPDVAVSRNNLGLLLYDLDRPVDAIEHLERALGIWLAHLGEDHPEVATARNNLGMVLERAGRVAEAETEYREALRIRVAALGESNRSTIAVRHNLGLVMLSLDKHAEAEAQIREAVAQWANILPSEHPFHAIAHNSLGLVLEALERHTEAEQAFRIAVDVGEVAYGSEHPQMCQFWNNFARALMHRHADTDALALTRKSLAVCEEKLGPEHRTTQRAREHLETLLARMPMPRAEQ